MGKSYTRKKFKHHSKAKIDHDHLSYIRGEVDSTVTYIEEWKRKELLDLILRSPTNKLPIIPIRDNLIVGRHAIKKVDEFFYLYDSRFDDELVFVSKTSALCYSLCSQKGYQGHAKNILDNDRKYSKFLQDWKQFNYLKRRSLNKKDIWQYDFYSTMASNTGYKLNEAKKQLEKSLTHAKYIKIWE